MPEDAVTRAASRRSSAVSSAGDPAARAKGFLWLCAATAIAGVAGATLGGLAGHVSTSFGILIGAVASVLVLYAFDLMHRTTRFVELMWCLGPLALAVAVFRFAPSEGTPPVRRVLVLGMMIVWAVRVTALWVRRLRSPSEESSVNARLRERYRERFWLVSLGVLHLGPAIVLFLGALSFIAIFSRGSSGLNIIDIAASGLTLAGLVIEGVADLQLGRFLRATRVPTRVCDEGLYSILRHPRYLGEMMFWWGLSLFALAAHATAWWSAVGPLALTLLVVLYAAPRRDRREVERRPDYAAYMRRVPAFLPSVLK